MHTKNALIFHELLDKFNNLDKERLRNEIIKNWTGPYGSSFFSFLKFKVWLRYVFWTAVRKVYKWFK